MPPVMQCRPGTIIGHRKNGQAIYLMAGASPEGDPAGDPQGGQQPQGQQPSGGEPPKGEDLEGLKSALAAERAQRKEFERAAKRTTELEAELTRYREANQTETEKAISKAAAEADAKARAEVSTQFQQRLVTAEIRAAAGGKLRNPQYAVKLLDGGEFIGKDGEPDRAAIDKAIDALLKDDPLLGVEGKTPSFDGGQRNGTGNSAPDFNQTLRRGFGRS